MKNLTWQNPEQLFVAQKLIKKVKLKCCGIWVKNNVRFAENQQGGRCHIVWVQDDDLPLKDCPSVVHAGQEQGEEFATQGVFVHLFVETMFFHACDAIDKCGDFVAILAAASEHGFGLSQRVVVFLVFHHYLAVLFGNECGTGEVGLQDGEKLGDFLEGEVHEQSFCQKEHLGGGVGD